MFGRLFTRRRGAPAPVPIVLYTRSECPLCDEMKAILAAARTARPFTVREVDIDSDEDLVARHGRSVPVLEIAGRTAFKGRMRAEEFEPKLERLASGWRSGSAS